MFLERCGIFCFSKIRPALFYLALLIPFFLVVGYLLKENGSLEEMENRFMEAVVKEKPAIARKTRKDRFIKRHANSDPFYLDKQIESFTFLECERLKIESLINHPAIANKRSLQQRLDFIQSPDNRLSFTEENIHTSPKIKETEEKQRHPVQMDENDLQKLFTCIEDIPLGTNDPVHRTPQLIVSDCKIKKIETPLHSEAFEVQMELLKREWIE